MSHPYKVYGSCVSGLKIVEGHVLTTDKNSSGKQVVANTNIPPSKRAVIDVSWLTGASEAYSISPDIKDYIIIPVPIITTDVPNRNMQAWPYSEVTYFDPTYGTFVYNTFKGKPTYIDHHNDVPKEAKGVHLDASFHYVPKYKTGKIVVLTAWDRTKDEHLTRQILKGERDSYSMGCLVNTFICAICGTPYAHNRLACPHQMDPHMPRVEVLNGRLNYMHCVGNCFFETSSVSCLIPNTFILANNEARSMQWLIDNMSNDTFTVKSFDTTTGNYVEGVGHSPRVTKEVMELSEVTFSNGCSEQCTHDHPWMLEDGSYCDASDLKEGYKLKAPVEIEVKSSVKIKLNEPVKVCDITVEKYHNFSLANGAIVHNSPADPTAFSQEILSLSL